MMVFMFPETQYIRTITATSESPSSNDDSQVFEPKAENIREIPKTTMQVFTGSDSKASLSTRSINYVYNSHRLPIGRPSRKQFSLIHKPYLSDNNIVFRDAIAPIQIFTFPIILWATFSFGFAANCLLALNLTQSQVFAAPPYLFTPAQVGFVNLAFVVGGIVGLLTAGPFSDWVSMRATRGNSGVREAEMRLIALVPYTCICLISMTVSSIDPNS